jgi:CRP-like cAMP-binding protein
MHDTADLDAAATERSDAARRPAPAPAGAALRNRLLLSLPPNELELIRMHLEPCKLEPLQLLVDGNAPIAHVYFPDSGIISVLSRLDDGTLIENGTVGYEGMAGLPLVLGVDWTPSVILGQVPGTCHRIAAAAFRELLPSLPTLATLLHRYAVAFLAQLSQSLACNSLHSVNQRCARWLLMTDDRVSGSEFLLTHEVLAQMLAVRRAGVSEAAGALQRAGLIRYTRGRVTVVDRAGLEAASCECYGSIRAQRQRLLGAYTDSCATEIG